jgi:hypothetical protein
MQNPDQLPLFIAFMLFTFVVMGGMSWVFAKWMKQHRDMERQWLANDQSQGHDHAGHDHHNHH